MVKAVKNAIIEIKKDSKFRGSLKIRSRERSF
jgi:hypothetical protein